MSSPEAERLLAEFIATRADPDPALVERLLAFLRADPDLRARARAHLELDQLLGRELGREGRDFPARWRLLAEAVAPSGDRFPQRVRRRLRSRRGRRWWLVAGNTAVLAAALLVVVLGPWRGRHAVVDGPCLVTAGAGERPLDDGGRVRSGTGLRALGAAALTLPDGSRIELEAGTRLVWERLGGEDRIALAEGGIRCAVVTRTAAFTVATAHGAAEVLGTRFRVVADAARSEVTVEEGRVRVRAGGASRDLAPGASVIADRHGLRPPPLAAPLVAGETAAPDWRLAIDGRAIPVRRVPTWRDGVAGLAIADADGPLVLELSCPDRSIRSAQVLPRSAGLAAEVVDGRLRLLLPAPRMLTLAVDCGEERILHLALRPPERDAPPPEAPGVRHFPPGLHEPTTLRLRDGETLHLAAGAVLRPRLPADEPPEVARDWAGQPVHAPFIGAEGARRVTIRGRGILDLGQLPWHARMGVVFDGCTQIRIEGITILDAPSWAVLLQGCQEAVVRDLCIVTRRENGTGVAVSSSRAVSVEDCLLRCADDPVSVKATDPSLACEDILVRRCTVWNEHARALGVCQVRAPVRRVRFSDCDIIRDLAEGGHDGGCLVALVDDAGTIEDLVFTGIRIERSRAFLGRFRIGRNAFSQDDRPGRLRDVTLERIDLRAGRPRIAVEGLDAQHRVEQIVIRDLRVDGAPVTDAAAAGLEANAHVGTVAVGR